MRKPSQRLGKPSPEASKPPAPKPSSRLKQAGKATQGAAEPSAVGAPSVKSYEDIPFLGCLTGVPEGTWVEMNQVDPGNLDGTFLCNRGNGSIRIMDVQPLQGGGWMVGRGWAGPEDLQAFDGWNSEFADSVDGYVRCGTEDELKALMRKEGVAFEGDPMPRRLDAPEALRSPITRVHGRVGSDQEFVEFETPDRQAFITQRLGDIWSMFHRYPSRSGKGSDFSTLGSERSLAEGEARALKLAQDHLNGLGVGIPEGRFEFMTTCVGADAEALREMYDLSVEVDLDVIRKHCDLTSFEAYYGYGKRGFMKLEDEPNMKCFRSFYQGRPCLGFTHGGTDHIWIPEQK